LQLPRGVQLDLGATAKAKAADDAARLAHDATGAPVLVSLGGDVAVCGTPAGHAWPVGVGELPGSPTSTVLVAQGGVATSTVLLRRWTQGGTARHHLLDPVTGLPVSGRLRSATVAAGSCLAANAASTAVLVRPVGAVAWLREAQLPARLVDRDGGVERVGGWPADTGGEVAA
jgi:thiamine biosynthesis lipoprotein